MIHRGALYLLILVNVKVRMQTSTDSTLSMSDTLSTMYQDEGIWAFYKSLTAIWGRQIPYTMMKVGTTCKHPGVPKTIDTTK
jgi:hypothetical protein